jgi:hypothetical protein
MDTYITYKEHEIKIVREFAGPGKWFRYSVSLGGCLLVMGEMQEKSQKAVFSHIKWDIDTGRLFPNVGAEE